MYVLPAGLFYKANFAEIFDRQKNRLNKEHSPTSR